MATHLQPHTPLFIVPTQWTNDQRGDYFERFIAELLTLLGWQCKTRIRCTGMEIDVLAKSRLTKDVALVQCKFQRDPLQSGVIDLLLGQALRKEDVTNTLLFSIGPLGKEARGVVEELEAKPLDKSFGFLGPDRILELLEGSSSPPPKITYKPAPGRSVASSHLLLHPDYPRVWLHEEQHNGLPVRVIVDGGSSFDCESLAAAVHAAGLFEDVPFEGALTPNASLESTTYAANHDTVALVPVADLSMTIALADLATLLGARICSGGYGHSWSPFRKRQTHLGFLPSQDIQALGNHHWSSNSQSKFAAESFETRSLSWR